MKLVNKTGYLKGAKTAKNPVNIIPSNLITTQGMAFPIKANGKTLYPNTGQYKFPTSPVVETPLKQNGANELEGDLISKVVMNRNKDKDFVQRAYAAGKYPKSNMFNTFVDFDTKATHKMGYGEDDKGQTYMYPTIMNPNNEDIKIPKQYAEYIANKGYKKATGMSYQKGTKKIKKSTNTKPIPLSKAEIERKADSTLYANNVVKTAMMMANKNMSHLVLERRPKHKNFGKKTGNNTCLTTACAINKMTGTNLPYNLISARNADPRLGDNAIETRYNPSFLKDHKKLGYKLLSPNDKMQAGDVMQVVKAGVPAHAKVFLGNDKGPIIVQDHGENLDDKGVEITSENFRNPFKTVKDANSEYKWIYRYMGLPKNPTPKKTKLPIKKYNSKTMSKTDTTKFKQGVVSINSSYQKGTKSTKTNKVSKANPISTPSLGPAFTNPPAKSNNLALTSLQNALVSNKTSPNVEYTKQLEAYKKYIKDVSNRERYTLASGRADPTIGPIDAAIAGVAGLPGATLRLAGGALNSTLGATIPGVPLTVGQGLTAYGGYDAVANKAPSFVRNVKKGNYEGAAVDAALGGLGILGLKQLGVMDPTKLKTVARLSGKKFNILDKKLKEKATNLKYKLEDEVASAKLRSAGLVNSGRQTKNIIKTYRQKTNPSFQTQEDEKLMKSMRNLGMSLKENEDLTLPELEKLLAKTKNVPDSDFRSLVRKSKQEVENLAQVARQQNPQLAQNLKQPPTDDVDWNSVIRQVNSNQSTYKRPHIPPSIRIDPVTGSTVYGPNITYNRYDPNIIDKFNKKLETFLNKRLVEEKITPYPSNAKELVKLMTASSGRRGVIRQAKEAADKIEYAAPGESFVPSGSLSTDSYPFSYKMLPKFLKEGKVDLEYHGDKTLNGMGYSDDIQLDKGYNLREINSVIKNIRETSGKKIPYAYIDNNGTLRVPTISVTRLNNALSTRKTPSVQSVQPSNANQLPPPPSTINLPFKNGTKLLKYKEGSKGVSLAFSRGEKDPKGGLTQKGVDKYNRATGGNLKMAVTTPPSKLKEGSKASNRRKSFCARMSGVKGPMTKPNGEPSRKALALKKWNC
jgi:hypothetical protein